MRILHVQVTIKLLNVSTADVGQEAGGGENLFAAVTGVPRVDEPLKARALLVRAKVYRSEMSINQKNVTFGRMEAGLYAAKKLTIANRSAIPLLYALTKSASINSGFLKIPGQRRGLIPAFQSREVEVGLVPGLPGKFEETVEVLNVQGGVKETITVKAKVVRPETFVLEPLGGAGAEQGLDFGTLLIGERSPTLQFTIRNVSSKRRRCSFPASKCSDFLRNTLNFRHKILTDHLKVMMPHQYFCLLLPFLSDVFPYHCLDSRPPCF